MTLCGYLHEKIKVLFPMKVVGAKVVTNARSPGARCYGFVTMSTSDEATKCISHLHRTELHGRMISVEKVRQSLPVITHELHMEEDLVCEPFLSALYFRPKTNLLGKSCLTERSVK